MFSYLNLPLDQAVGIGVPVNTEQEEPLPLLVITIVCIQNLSMGVLCKTIPNKNKDENPDKTIFAVVLNFLGTFLISAMISLGSLLDVVFMLQVKRSERGLTSPLSLTAWLTPPPLVLPPGVALPVSDNDPS